MKRFLNSIYRATVALVSVTLLCAIMPIRFASAGETPIAIPPLADGTKPPLPKINDEELRRVVVAPSTKFPWIGKPVTVPVKVKAPVDPAIPGAPPADGGMDMSGDMIIRAMGPFTREEKKSVATLELPDKAVMTMTENVEIEMIESRSVLRGQHIVIITDIKTGDTELIEAKGNVEIVSPERTGKGEIMRFEMQKGVNGEMIKDTFTLIGDPAAGKKATLWMKKDPLDDTKTDVIEATRFVRDNRNDTFKATGAPNAIITMADETEATPDTKKSAPADGKKAISLGAQSPDKPPAKAPKPAAAKPAASGGAGGGMGAISMSGGGKVNMRCDAEMFFDGTTGKLKLTRNVVFIKEGLNPGEGMKMCADDAIVTLDVPPPGQPAPAGSAFGGDMKMIECFGRVEIKTGVSTILCDKMKMDAERNVAFMEMNSATDTVLVYNADSPLGGSTMIVPKSLKMNLDTRELEPGGPMKTRTFGGAPGSNRGNGPKPEDVKPLPDPKAKSSPLDGKKPDPKKPARK